nr:hypothetical protein [Microvirga arabica]
MDSNIDCCEGVTACIDSAKLNAVKSKALAQHAEIGNVARQTVRVFYNDPIEFLAFRRSYQSLNARAGCNCCS